MNKETQNNFQLAKDAALSSSTSSLSHLPKGWDVKKLVDIAIVSTGKWDASHASKNGKFRFYTCAYDYLYSDTKRFFGECLILPGNGVNVGEVFYYNGEFDAYQRTYIVSDIKISPKYLHLHMLLYWKEFGTKKQYGSATNFIKIGNFRDYTVKYPPLPKQKRIVSVLGRVFEVINKAKANAQQNLKNVKELFESYLNGIFEKGGDDWEEKRLGDILLNPPKNGWSPPAKNQSTMGTPVLTLSAVTGFIFNSQSVKYTSASYNFDAHYWVENGDLLITRSNTPELVGHVAICDNLSVNTIYPDLIMKIRPNQSKVHIEFLYYNLRSSKVRNVIKRVAHGANPTMKKINQQDVKSLPICFPSQQLQGIITSNLKVILDETKKLESIYQQKVEDLDELKKSILQKAFRGEL